MLYLSVEAIDEFANPCIGYEEGTVSLRCNKRAHLPPPYRFCGLEDRGEHTFSLTIKECGPCTISLVEEETKKVKGTLRLHVVKTGSVRSQCLKGVKNL